MQPNRPVIMKSYVAGNSQPFSKVDTFATKVILLVSSVVLVVFILICLSFCNLWLDTVPEYTIYFVK